MVRARVAAAGLAVGLCLSLWGYASTPGITEAQKIAIIRDLIAEVAIARQPLPPDKKGVELDAAGRVLNPSVVEAARYDSGRAAKVGDRIAITAIQFRANRIVFLIDGGPHGNHWYNHITMGMGSQPISQPSNQIGAHGAVITLRFDPVVPELTPEAVKKDLSALIDWDPPSEAEAMVQPLPASVKTAIQQHRALVGMSQEMVVAALGRTGNKSGETDAQGQAYEDWIYGEPPAATTFVRFVGDLVVRVTVYHPDGTQTVENQPDPALAAWNQQRQQQSTARAQQADQPAPSLRRPGDAPAPGAGAAGQTLPPQMAPMPGSDTTPPGTPPTTTGPPGSGFPPTTGPPVCCGNPGL